jgi:hypothetical protein
VTNVPPIALPDDERRLLEIEQVGHMSGLVVTVENGGKVLLCMATNVPLVLPSTLEDATAVRQALLDAVEAFSSLPRKDCDHG